MLHWFMPHWATTKIPLQPNLSIEVLGLEEISHVLRLGVRVLGMVVVIRVGIICGSNVVHLVGRSALHAAGLGLLASKGDPEHAVRVGRVAGAANVLLVAGRVDGDGVLWGACARLVLRQLISYCSALMRRIFQARCYVPRRLASNGLMSKMSIPCIFPRISRRSRPVACS
jgi:hypothetical protein